MPFPRVRANGEHVCRAIGCLRTVPYHILMCRRHWCMVPKELQARVYRAWGQFQKGWEGSRQRYLNVVKEAIQAAR